VLFAVHATQQKQQILWIAALKQIGSALKREPQPQQVIPERLRELIAQLEANSPPKDKEQKRVTGQIASRGRRPHHFYAGQGRLMRSAARMQNWRWCGRSRHASVVPGRELFWLSDRRVRLGTKSWTGLFGQPQTR
jgi:hypothetical protein